MKLEFLLWILVVLLLCLGVGSLLVWWRRVPPLPPGPETPPPDLQLESLRITFKEPVPFDADRPTWSAQSEEWRARMHKAGAILKQRRVGAIIFLHGTFTGSDPLDILPSLRTHLPRVHKKVESSLQKVMRHTVDKIARDNGNFLQAYIKLFAEATQMEESCHHFEWPSANHHIARLRGALALIAKIATIKSLQPQQRVLLIGHSHARQVFALFTHLLAETEVGTKLWSFCRQHALCSDTFQNKTAHAIDAFYFDFVTLGGPVRYNWAFLPDMHVLHLINHRGSSLHFEKNRGFWRTESGDYIQQWGTVGSDVLANSAKERRANRQLDHLLGKGLDTRVWLQTLSRRQRLGNFGRTLLIDYGDNTRIMPNFIGSIFGHGVYTRYKAMLFNTQHICRHLYQEDIDTEK